MGTQDQDTLLLRRMKRRAKKNRFTILSQVPVEKFLREFPARASDAHKTCVGNLFSFPTLTELNAFVVWETKNA